MKTSDFNFELPEELIAQYPLKERSSSRLLCLDNGQIQHQSFANLPSLLQPGDLLVLNNTRVMPARLYAQKLTGGRVEILVERLLDSSVCLAHVRSNKALKLPTTLLLENGSRAIVQKKMGDLYELAFETPDLRQLLAEIGSIPLPHYMKREAQALDADRYQTIYSSEDGAVAAPTAGLHFDESVFAELRQNEIDYTFITLHVGAGTFKPVVVDDFRDHKMHSEIIDISSGVCALINEKRAQGSRIIAVGTTSVRALETAMQGRSELAPFSGETDIFIYPGYQFQCVDGLITNFHLPCSTLIMLVCALGGYSEVMAAYETAIKERYRFYSYGDAMLVTKQANHS